MAHEQSAEGSPLRLVGAGLTVRYAGLLALSGVDFSVSSGEVVGLIGPNGSGKTTLLNVLSGVTRATAGTLSIGGEDITKKAAHQVARRGVARTFQNIRLFGNMTVLENVQVGSALNNARYRGAELHDAAEQIVSSLGLAQYQERRASTLPYGVRRRVEIARALATQPDFLLLDEPAAGANESESDDLCGLIEKIMADYRLGILVIEHDLRLMMRVAHRIVALTEGRVVAEGDAEYISKHQAVREAYFGKRWAEEQDKQTAQIKQHSAKEAL